jgi:hypothetical protein
VEMRMLLLFMFARTDSGEKFSSSHPPLPPAPPRQPPPPPPSHHPTTTTTTTTTTTAIATVTPTATPPPPPPPTTACRYASAERSRGELEQRLHQMTARHEEVAKTYASLKTTVANQSYGDVKRIKVSGGGVTCLR